MSKRAKKLQGSLIVSYRRALQAAEAAFAERIGTSRADVTFRQFVVLQGVAEAPDANQTKLVEITSMDRSTLSDVINRMIEKRLLIRTRSGDDGRANLVRLTSQGHAALNAARRAGRAANKVLAEQLPGLLEIATDTKLAA